MISAESPSLQDREEPVPAQSKETEEQSPTYNGLTPEAFLAGAEMMEAWEKLSQGTKVELAPHLLRHIIYQLYSDQLSVDQIEEVAQSLEQGLSGMQSAKRRIEDSLRPRDILPEDY